MSGLTFGILKIKLQETFDYINLIATMYRYSSYFHANILGSDSKSPHVSKVISHTVSSYTYWGTHNVQ